MDKCAKGNYNNSHNLLVLCVCVCVCVYIAFQCGVKLMIILKMKVICVKFYALEYFFLKVV